MNHKEKLEALREVIVAANPTGQWMEHGQGVTQDANGNLIAELRNRPVRLADVLLAIDKTERDLFVDMGGCFWEQNTTLDGDAPEPVANAVWNLRKDSLAEQSEETIDFLHTLLTQNKNV